MLGLGVPHLCDGMEKMELSKSQHVDPYLPRSSKAKLGMLLDEVVIRLFLLRKLESEEVLEMDGDGSKFHSKDLEIRTKTKRSNNVLACTLYKNVVKCTFRLLKDIHNVPADKVDFKKDMFNLGMMLLELHEQPRTISKNCSIFYGFKKKGKLPKKVIDHRLRALC
ncbi:hypothetical protein DVH24_035566 [Malus domestica]|uniref:Uncharacterized protein n=1 Tax=Malus domestica TaxID=3750 RepID=A0A498JAH4_MALDO|nr:hypothetical protein DVH24_035566 [Malus domestica]